MDRLIEILRLLDEGNVNSARYMLSSYIADKHYGLTLDELAEEEEEEVSEEEQDMYCPIPDKYKDLERVDA